MKVVREDLHGTQVQRLVASESHPPDYVEGEVVGYYCAECRQTDETRDQIWHEKTCSLAGQHGREHYDGLQPAPDDPAPELDPDTEFIVIESAETEGRGGLCEGEVLGFVCTCGNADEDLFEIVHDEACPLAGVHDRVAVGD
uniref:hypothetical protein n=1 Tax=Halorussus halobius TaxID=1710537 RepID=UPI00143D8322